MPLDEGRPNEAMRPALEALRIDGAFEHARLVDIDMARCCHAGLWLLHDFLDESHTISQGVGTPSGSFWHGIMHRREGDFSNAKYWFHRVGHHHVYAELAMPDGGTLTLRTLLGEDQVMMVVEDDGVGMSNEVARQVFVPFFTTKDVGVGTGLGLSVVHGIVASHGGSIRIASRPGGGTRVEVALPAKTPQEANRHG